MVLKYVDKPLKTLLSLIWQIALLWQKFIEENGCQDCVLTQSTFFISVVCGMEGRGRCVSALFTTEIHLLHTLM